MEEVKVHFSWWDCLVISNSIGEIVIISITMESTIENFTNEKEMWRNATKTVK